MRIFPERRRAIRLAVLLAVLAAVLGYRAWRTAWWPGVKLETAHYAIRSNATPEQTAEAARALEALHRAYTGLLAGFPDRRKTDGLLKVNLYRDRDEFRRCNRRAGWAEAFYRKGCCYAYHSGLDANPHHWLMHEAVHQLNHEVTRLGAPKWIDEGLASYFSAGLYEDGGLDPGRPNGDAYPIWWLFDLHLTADLEADIAAGHFIPLRAIITGTGGPDLDEAFNLYYVHWWSLSHFLLEADGARRRDAYLEVIRDGGRPDAFEKRIGPFGEVQADWHAYLRELQEQALRGEFSPRRGNSAGRVRP